MKKHSNKESEADLGIRVYSENEILQRISQMRPLTIAELRAGNKWSFGAVSSIYSSMNTYERMFAQMLLRKGMVVYREVEIAENGATADFYVFNPRSNRGKLVEITLLQKEYVNSDKKPSIKTIRRKDRQLQTLQATGMPFVVLYKENFRSIRRTVKDLF